MILSHCWCKDVNKIWELLIKNLLYIKCYVFHIYVQLSVSFPLVDLSNEANALKENLGEEEEIPTDDEINAALHHVSTMASIMTNIHSDMAGAFKTDKFVPVWADAIAIDIAARYTVLRKIIMSGDEGLIETTAPDFLGYMEIYAGKVDTI